MEVKVLSFYLGQWGIYGFEILNFDMENKERGLLCFVWSPKVSVWIDVMFVRIIIPL